ncbi:MAG TPA: hypothetical protein VFU54_08810 [Actinomycetota bacterium]|nr:hypothetical protein [Actinomycetota bacterium]
MAVFTRSSPPPRPVRSVALLAAALLLAACTSGGERDTGSATTAAPTTAIPSRPLEVTLRTTARGPERGFNAERAAKRAAPGIERFLDRYLTTAFVDAAGGDRSWDRLLAMFDKPVRAAARKQLDAVSLGAAVPTVTSVQPGRASAMATVLYGSRPVAATVRLSFDGTAATAQGNGPVQLRSVLQLLWTRSGWQIAAFDSRTGAPR